jgi:hypothetical protein
MGGGKESGSAKTYDYFGTIAGLVAWGPVDGIHAVLVDGKEIFAAPAGGLAASGDSTDLQPVDPKWLHDKNGYLRIYWGTQNQPANPELGPNHPPYRGFCYVVFHRFLFGRERSAAPNVEVVVWRKPRPPSFLLPAGIDDGQINPVAVMAEWIVGLMGLEQPEEIFDAQSWIDAAAWVWNDPDRRARMALSCLLADTGDIRGRIGAVLELTELALYWDENGFLAVRILDLGEVPAGLPVIDARFCTRSTVLRSGGWSDVPTGVFTRFIDRDRRWKEAGQKIDNILARHLRGEPNRQELDLPWITREGQAAAIAARYLVRAGRPVSTINVQVRSASADQMQIGSKVLVDVEPEPGGSALAQSSIVIERREPREGSVSLTLRADTLAEAIPYIPAWIPAAETGLVSAPILDALVVPLSTEGWELDSAVAVLAARPQADAVGFRLYVAPASDPNSFTRLGDQTGFAVEVELMEAMNPLSTEATLRLVKGPDGPDAYLAGRTPDDIGEANRDVLLAILAQLDGSGRVVIENNLPVIEFLSVIARAVAAPEPPAPADTWFYSVLRSRKGSDLRDWPVGTRGWIVPLVNVAPWTHPVISNLARNTDEGRIRMVAFTRYAEDDSTPIPERGFFLPLAYSVYPKIAWTAPVSNPADTNASGQIAIDLMVTDVGGDLVRLSVVSRRGSDPVVTHLDETFPQTDSRRFNQTLTFSAEGVYTLQVSAQDSAEHETISLWQIVRIPAAGGGGATVTFDPPSGYYWPSMNSMVLVAAGYDSIRYKVTKPQPNPPADPGSWSLVNGAAVSIPIAGGNKYVWAVGAHAGVVSDTPVFASYILRKPGKL